MALLVLNATALTESGGDPVVTKYIFFNGKRVAMDRNGVVQYLVGDHLGTTSLVLNANGTVHSEARHYPYGEERWSSGTVPTDYRFTGQRSETGLGDVYHMGARWYDSYINRFISPDSIIPQPQNPQSFNRYAYCLGNPLRFRDPSGHDPLDDQWRTEFGQVHGRPPEWYDILIRLFSIAFPDEWDWNNFYDSSGQLRGATFDDYGNLTSSGVLRKIFFEPGVDRNWGDVPDALARLAGWYQPDETEAFARDVGTLFGGLLDRFEEPSMFRSATHGPLPAHDWVQIQVGGMPFYLTGTDDDANIHHWAWSFALGYTIRSAAVPIHALREAMQVEYPITLLGTINSVADTWLGSLGALMGMDVREFGASPSMIYELWRIYIPQLR